MASSRDTSLAIFRPSQDWVGDGDEDVIFMLNFFSSRAKLPKTSAGPPMSRVLNSGKAMMRMESWDEAIMEWRDEMEDAA